MNIKAEAQQLFDAYVVAYRTGDTSECAAVFVEDGLLLSQYASPARGREAIAAIHKTWTALPGNNGKQIVVSAAASAGEVGWCLTTYSEEPGVEEGSSLNVLERQHDGRWLIRICSINPNDAPLAG